MSSCRFIAARHARPWIVCRTRSLRPSVVRLTDRPPGLYESHCRRDLSIGYPPATAVTTGRSLSRVRGLPPPPPPTSADRRAGQVIGGAPARKPLLGSHKYDNDDNIMIMISYTYVLHYYVLQRQ